MANKLPSGKYRVQVFIGYDENGKRKYKYFTADTKNQAELAALQFKATLPKTERGILTVDKGINNYIVSNGPVMSPATVRGYNTIRRQLRNNVPELSDAKLYSVDKVFLQHCTNKLLLKYSRDTVKHIIDLIHSSMEFCGYAPVAVNFPPAARPELSIPDEDTIKRLYEAVKGTKWEVPVLLAVTGPMRRGEIVAASIDDLHDDNTLYIHRSMCMGDNGYVLKEYPKTDGSNRYIKLSDGLADLIRKQGYVTKMSIGAISAEFGRMLEKNGLPRFRFHDLRHSFVSIAHAEGIPDAYIMARGGWSSPHVMQNVYRHTLNEDRKKMENTINQKLSGIMGIE